MSRGERKGRPGGDRKERPGRELHILQKATRKHKNVAVCGDAKEKWQCLSLAVDSGACDNVIDPKDVSAYEENVKETEASRNNENFLAANGEEIPNFGEHQRKDTPRNHLSGSWSG